MKLLKKVFIILIIMSLTALPAIAEEGEHDGYIVKYKGQEDYVLCDEIPMQLFGMRSEIEYVEPNYYMELFGDVPRDPYYVHGKQWNLSAIEAEAMWKKGHKGEGVKIAVIDSGVTDANGELTHCLLEGVNCHHEATDTSDYADLSGHGTLVCGIIGAQWNNRDTAGIAPDTKILPIKCTKSIYDAENQRYEESLTTYDVKCGIDIAIEAGCDIINLSLGGEDHNILEEAINKAYNKGIIVVAAAGNYGGTDILYPAGYDNVIGVGAVYKNNDGEILHALYSQKNESVFVVAPGGQDIGTSRDYIWGTSIKSGYINGGTGTSFSCPTVAAVAALALSMKSNLTNEEFKTILKISCDDLGSNGYDTQYGYGLVNCEKMVNIISGQEIYASPIRQVNETTYETTLINWTDSNESLKQINFIKNSNGSISNIEISYVPVNKGETKTITISSKGGNGRILLTQGNIMKHVSDIMEH